MVAQGKNQLRQERSVSMALFLTQNLFDASGIDLHTKLQSSGSGEDVCSLGLVYG